MIKLFTHTDLDGVGCYIVAAKAFGTQNVDVEYCEYDDINIKVVDFLTRQESSNYEAIYITDISVNEETAAVIESYKGMYIKLFDHHSTARWLNKYKWALVLELEESGEKTSGTNLFYNEILSLPESNFMDLKSLSKFVFDVTMYDTWRWMNDFEVPYVDSKKLNNMCQLLGAEVFAKEILNGKTIKDFDLMFDIEEKRILTLIDKKRSQLKKSSMLDVNKNTKFFGYVFVESDFSEIGNILCKENTDLDFIAMIDISRKIVSLRSIDKGDGFRLGEDIAKECDGGGHAQASACKLIGTFQILTKLHLYDEV